MKKFLSAMMLILVLSSVSFGAVSEDMNVYVRQDVFDAKMEALFERMDKNFVELKSMIKSTENELKGDIKALSARIDGLEQRIGDVHNFLYWLIVLFGIILVLPFVNKLWDKLWESRRVPSFTLDDVKRLIAEAQLTKTQI